MTMILDPTIVDELVCTMLATNCKDRTKNVTVEIIVTAAAIVVVLRRDETPLSMLVGDIAIIDMFIQSVGVDWIDWLPSIIIL
jgi:hypothetical protein